MSKKNSLGEITPRDVVLFLNDIKYWILGSVVVCLVSAWIFTRNVEKNYTATAKIFLDLDERNYNTIISDEFSEIQRLTTPKSRTKVDYEMSILQSVPVITAAVESSEMNVCYYLNSKREREKEIYGYRVPIRFQFCNLKLENYPKAYLKLVLRDTASFDVEEIEIEGKHFDFNQDEQWKNCLFNDTLHCGKYDFVVSTKEASNAIANPINLIVRTTSSIAMANSFHKNISLENKPISQNIKITNMVNVQFENSNVQRSKDFIAALVDNYNALTLKERRDDIINTINIIDKRLEELAKDSSEVMPSVRHRPYPQVESSLIQYLIRVREESLIALKSVAPTACVVDKPTCSKTSAKPNPKQVFMLALVIGILLPVFVEVLRRSLNTKVIHLMDIKNNCDVPIMAVLNKDCLVKNNQLNSFSSLDPQFLLNIYSREDSTILNMCEFNEVVDSLLAVEVLAQQLAETGKRVLVVDCNLRNKTNVGEGVAQWLIGTLQDWRNVVAKHNNALFDLLPAGAYCSNPMALLQSDKMDDLFRQLKSEYGYIVLLSSPYLQNVDTLLLAQKSDVNLFVVRKSVTKIADVEHLQERVEKNLIHNLAICYVS